MYNMVGMCIILPCDNVHFHAWAGILCSNWIILGNNQCTGSSTEEYEDERVSHGSKFACIVGLRHR